MRLPGAPSAPSGQPHGAPPAVTEAFDPNDLSGHWESGNGGYELARVGDRYDVRETGLMGQTGRGQAVRRGNTLHLVIDNLLLGRIAVDLQFDGKTLRGTVNVMGMPMPLVLTRTSGPKAPAKTPTAAPAILAKAPPDLAARFTNRMEAAAAAQEAGATEDAQRLYVQALEIAMESPQPDDDVAALGHLLALARYTTLSVETLERCFDCLDGLIDNGHRGDALAPVLSLLIQDAWGHLDSTRCRRLAEHGLTLLAGPLSPANQALVGWASAAMWMNLGERDRARETLSRIDRAAVPAEMQPLLAHIDQVLST